MAFQERGTARHSIGGAEPRMVNPLLSLAAYRFEAVHNEAQDAE